MQGCVRQAHDSALQEAESRCACAYQQLRAVFGSEPLDAASLEDSRMASVRARVAEQCPTPSHGPASSVVEPAGTR